MTKYMTQLESLTPAQALSILQSPDVTKLSSGWEPPCIGDVHLLKVSSRENLQERLASHGLKWISHGRDVPPSRRNPLVTKLYHRCTALKMTWICYVEWNRNRDKTYYALVQYVVDRNACVSTFLCGRRMMQISNCSDNGNLHRPG